MKEKVAFGDRLRSPFSTKVVVLIPIAVGINVIGGMLSSVLKLPLFLDTIGTVVIACLASPWVAALCGLLTSIFLALVANPVFLPYAVVSVLCGLTVGYMVRAGLFKRIWGVCLIWIALTLVNAFSAGIVTFFVFGGATGVNATSFLTASLVAATREIFLSVMTSALLENFIDKGISLAIAYVIVRKIPRRFISQYMGATKAHRAADPDDFDDVDDAESNDDSEWK
ncbi:ECF transporter S component [Actinomycetaceae bacterium L2_0104]